MLKTRIGLTGGIASGKSTLCALLVQRGWHIIDSDAVAHHLMQPGMPNWKDIVSHFGRQYLKPDYTIDRQLLGQYVYSHPEELAYLSGMSHPRIRAEWLRLREEHERIHPQQPRLVAVPLLYEHNAESCFDQIWCVAARPEIQLERLIRTRGLTREAALARIASQLPLQDKLAKADAIIWSDDSMSAQLDSVLARLETPQT